MKLLLSVLIVVFCSQTLSAQDQIAGKKYPYRIIRSSEKFPAGNYIFKTYLDYLHDANSDPTRPVETRTFFSAHETGVVLSREFNSGGYDFNVDRVEETDHQVIVYSNVITPKGMRTWVISPRIIFIAMKKTSKEIVIMEITG